MIKKLYILRLLSCLISVKSFSQDLVADNMLLFQRSYGGWPKHYKEEKIAFCADLIPSSGHLGLAYVMAYDTRPLLSMSEKADFLSTAIQENWTLFFEHDPKVECAKIIAGEKGVKIASTHLLADLT